MSGGYSGEGAGQGMVEKRGEDDKEEGKDADGGGDDA